MKQLIVWIAFIITGYKGIAQAGATPMHQQTETYIQMLSVLWQQDAAEYRALCFQAFNVASLRINQLSKKDRRKNKLAIITDLDETILDNSYSTAQLIKDGREASAQTWKQWTQQSAATDVPGAAEFLQYASQKGITIFYISNRDTSMLQSTLLNLQKLKLPNADTAHMLFLTNTTSKEFRRNKIEKNYKVIMLMGDNLNDFMQVFETKNIADRKAETDNVKSDWGNKFIVLPNSTYGEWENALYEYQKNLSPQQKADIRLQLLKGYTAGSPH